MRWFQKAWSTHCLGFCHKPVWGSSTFMTSKWDVLIAFKDFNLILTEVGKAEEANDGFSGVTFRIETQITVRKQWPKSLKIKTISEFS